MTITHWELRKDAEVLGHITVHAWTFPWLQSEFEPTAAFDHYRDVFSEDFALLNAGEQDWDAWEAAYQKIADLDLAFVAVDAAAHQLMHDLLEAEDHRPWLRRLLRSDR